MPEGSEDDRDDQEPDPATRKWDESEFLDDKYKEPEEDSFGITPDIPEAPSADDANPQLQMRFWSLVVVFNVAMLALAVGAMLVLFRENVELGTQLFLAGVLVGAYGLYRYRTARETLYGDQNG